MRKVILHLELKTTKVNVESMKEKCMPKRYFNYCPQEKRNVGKPIQ
jgi:hypothetical protein